MAIYLYVMELIMLALFTLSAIHAWRAGRSRLLLLIGATVFGVMLELATIRQLSAYSYGRFFVMIWDVPLAIGVGWGVIIYSANLFLDHVDLPGWTLPLLAGLLGLNIDLSMDALAIRLGMWDWGMGLDVMYFGVPYPNFWAWFWVITSFTAAWRFLETRDPTPLNLLSALGAIAVGVASVLGTNAFIVYVIPEAARNVVVMLTLVAALLIVLIQRPTMTSPATAAPIFWVPFGFHLYFLIAGLISGTILQPPFLLGMALLMIALALVIHREAVRHLLARRASQRAPAEDVL